jgi:1-phosphofructokinase family hexose kinase
VWIGFLGGALGQECERGLSNLGIEVLPVRTKASTRANLEVIEDSGRITEILEPGGRPNSADRAELLWTCKEALEKRWPGTPLVISGSLPAGVPDDFYVRFIRAAHSAGSPVFLDASGAALSAGIEARPDFVKPNRSELETLSGRRLRTMGEVVFAAQKLISLGSHSAAVTMGTAGLVWIEKEGEPAWVAVPPKLKAVSTVGCGDTTLAGFAMARAKRLSGEPAVKFATACGAANCLAEREGQISRKDVEALIPRIKTKATRKKTEDGLPDIAPL